MTRVIDRTSEIRCQDLHPRDHIGILKPGSDAAFNFFKRQIRGDDQRQPVDISIIEDLE